MAEEEELSIEPVSLITKDFPIVVIKESAELTDDRRAQLLEQLDELLESGKPHALIMDLTNAGELPEGQRVFVSESLQLREELIASTWISVAIVVSSNAGANGELASFWQKAIPTSTQVFTNSMSAVVWTRQALEKQARAARDANEPAGLDGPRASDPSPRRSETTRRSEANVERSAKPRSAKNARTETSKKSLFRSPALWLVVAGVLMSGGLYALNASFEPGLSSSERDAFQQRKGNLAVRVFRKVGNKRVPLEAGEAIPPGSELRFEADLPSRAYVMILGARSATDSYVALADPNKRCLGPLALGKSILAPQIDISADVGQEWLHFVACSERVKSEECVFQNNGATLTCPSACAVNTFQVNKAAAGS